MTWSNSAIAASSGRVSSSIAVSNTQPDRDAATRSSRLTNSQGGAESDDNCNARGSDLKTYPTILPSATCQSLQHDDYSIAASEHPHHAMRRDLGQCPAPQPALQRPLLAIH
jgi:hypothetical protein